MSRQAKLIPIVATQSVSSLRSALPGDESWRTLLQCFRTKVFLATSDEFTAQFAADLCGRVDRLKTRYTIAESGQGAHVSLLTGRATASSQTLTASKFYSMRRRRSSSPTGSLLTGHRSSRCVNRQVCCRLRKLSTQ